MDMTDKEYIVYICSPTLNEKLEVKTSRNATILSLKEAIRPIHPNHPAASEQRIIYSGKVLEDTETLLNIIKKNDDEITPTFHLVVKHSVNSAKKQPELQPELQQQKVPTTTNEAESQPSSTLLNESSSSNPVRNESMFPSLELPTNPTGFNNNTPLTNNASFLYQPMMSYPQIPAYLPSSRPEAIQDFLLSPIVNNAYQVVIINGLYYLAPLLKCALPMSIQMNINQLQYSSIQHFDNPQALLPQYVAIQEQIMQFVNTQYPVQFTSDMYQALQQCYNGPHMRFSTFPSQYQQPQVPRAEPVNPVIQPFINAIPNNNNVRANVQLNRTASIWLMLKLAVVLFMLCQGASIERIFVFHIIAIVFFFYQTGRLRFVLRRVQVMNDANPIFAADRRNNAPVPPPPAPTTNHQQQAGATQQQQQDNAGSSTSVNNHNNENMRQRNTQGNGESSAANSNHATVTSPTIPARPPTTLDVMKRVAFTFLASVWPNYGHDPRIVQALENDNNNQRDGGMEEF